jgi:hypothetical protein
MFKVLWMKKGRINGTRTVAETDDDSFLAIYISEVCGGARFREGAYAVTSAKPRTELVWTYGVYDARCAQESIHADKLAAKVATYELCAETYAQYWSTTTDRGRIECVVFF